MAESKEIILDLKEKLTRLSAMPIDTDERSVKFLRELLTTLNKFFFVRMPQERVTDLQSRFYKDKDSTLPEWKRHTEFLAIWDDYAERVLSFFYPEERIACLAQRLLEIFGRADHLRVAPHKIDVDAPYAELGSMTAREFVFMHILHVSQDFTSLPAALDKHFVERVRTEFGRIPGPDDLQDEDNAWRFVRILKALDKKTNERIRYITEIAGVISEVFHGDAWSIFADCGGDAKHIYSFLTQFTGIGSKKANMILRDLYELGIWIYRANLDTVNIIADNRIMRIALRTGIVRSELPALLNDLLDQYDFQYMMTVACTEEAFRKVWRKCRELNGGRDLVTYPARFDRFFFRLANASTREGPIGCCGPSKIACLDGKRRDKFLAWLRNELRYECQLNCPLGGVCPQENRRLNPPFAIQNNTWDEIFTNEGGGGGLRGA